jgi:SAM-dependent methyltransferase
MPYLPDLKDPRYLDEIGWFLFHDRYERDQFGGSYRDERLAYSRLFLQEVLGYCGQNESWLADKTVVSIGGGCTADLATWPAAVKIAIDPLLYAYQKLGMLIEDAAGTSSTVHLALPADEIPLLDGCANLVVCRNALDHMLDPDGALAQMHRIIKPDGTLFLSVDIGGLPTPDEPTVFSVESLSALVDRRFEILTSERKPDTHSVARECSVRLLARRKDQPGLTLDGAQVLQAYMDRNNIHV